MIRIGIQSLNVIDDNNPLEGFDKLKRMGFDCCDFGLNGYLKNTSIYKADNNHFFDKSVDELFTFFQKHKSAAEEAQIEINQMHMPYPIYVPKGDNDLNSYLWNEVAPKSLEICHYFGCKNIVIHGIKLNSMLESEDNEWKKTEEFINSILQKAYDYDITICLENLYESIGGHLVEGPCCDINKTIDRIDSINSRCGKEILGFCLDTGHANIVGFDFSKNIKLLGKRLKVLHIHDNDGISDLHQIPYTFTRSRESVSTTDWNGFIAGLREIKFDGVLSFETAPVLTSFPDDLKDDVLIFINKIGQYLKQQIEMI